MQKQGGRYKYIYLYEIKMMKLSLVIPCYNEEDAIPIFYEETLRVTEELQTELELEMCFVDDGSSDRTLECIKELRKRDERVHFVSFSRNFGKEAALYAGLDMATGDYVATMDVDLQDPPYLLPEMYRIIKESLGKGKEEYDCVATRRVSRKGEPPIRSFFARLFYKIINKMSSTEIVDGARDFRFMSRKMVDAILQDSEYNRFTKGIYSWVGFNTKWLEFENVERSAGETKWSFWKLFLYSIDGILAYSTTPLSISSVLGIIFCFCSFVAMAFIFFRALIFGDPVAGWPSLICVIVFLGGIQLLCLGIMGLYIAKTYLESKKRPIYITREKE